MRRSAPRHQHTRHALTTPTQTSLHAFPREQLPTDLCMLHDKEFRKWVDIYAADEERFFADFSTAMAKLLALGTKSAKPWYQIW